MLSGFKKYWVIAYAIGLVLLPPFHIHDRLIFASEWMLLPLLIFGISRYPRRELLFVWGASFLAYVSGIFRDDLALKISIYNLGAYKYFRWQDDGLVLVRSLIIFSTPWFVKNFITENKSKIFTQFLLVLKVATIGSCILAILDYKSVRLINLENLGYYADTIGAWSYRAHGTFLTPLEASFMYGAMAIYLLTSSESLKNPTNAVTLILSLVAMILTHGGTAIGAFIISLGIFFVKERRRRNIDGRWIAALLVICGVFAFVMLPRVFFLQKLGDFIYRQKTYLQYLAVVRDHPYILLTGVGFSRICADNNFILLIIQGGILLFLAVLNWVRVLVKDSQPQLKYVFIFWILTWLSFDSLGYWGIGRLCWFLLGF